MTDRLLQEDRLFALFDNYRQIIDSRLHSYLDREGERVPRLREAMAYTLFAGGKRIRSAMMLAVCDMLNYPREMVLPAACAVEMIHTSSLIIDDLPSMDDAELRRGKPSIHRVFGEATAVLAGFALLNLSFDLITREMPETGCDAATARCVLREYTAAIGLSGMIGGQFLELENQHERIGLNLVEEIHHKKTGALFVAAIRSAALVAKVDEPQLAAVTLYAEKIGLMFQIVDDWLDAAGHRAELGKDVRKDQHITTFANHYSLIELDQVVRQLGAHAHSALQIFGDQANLLQRAIQLCIERRF